jgi:plasmid stabilization system protein ParE
LIRVVLHPTARAEFKAALRRYRQEAGREVAQRFYDEFWRCASWLRENPAAGASYGPEGVRTKLLRDHFPYTLYYVVLPSRIRIVVVAHQRQDVKGFSERLEP